MMFRVFSQAGFANVGEIDCRSNEKLCKKLGVEYGTRYFAAGEVEKGKDVVSDLTFYFSLVYVYIVYYCEYTTKMQLYDIFNCEK